MVYSYWSIPDVGWGVGVGDKWEEGQVGGGTSGRGKCNPDWLGSRTRNPKIAGSELLNLSSSLASHAVAFRGVDCVGGYLFSANSLIIFSQVPNPTPTHFTETQSIMQITIQAIIKTCSEPGFSGRKS